MTVPIGSLASEVRFIQSGLPLDELVKRSKIIDRLEGQLNGYKSDIKKFERVSKEATKEAKAATKQGNALAQRFKKDVKRLGDDINKATKPLQEKYKKVDDALQRVTKGADKILGAAGFALGLGGVVISLMALYTSERNQKAFDRSVNLFEIESARQGSFNQLIQNRFKKLRADFEAYKKKSEKTFDYQSQDIKLARSIADKARKMANDITYEARVRIKKLNDITAQANSNASKAIQQNNQQDRQIVQAQSTIKTIDAKVRTIDAKTTDAQREASQARIGVKLVDSKATTALTTAQQLPAKIPALVTPVVEQKIAPLKTSDIQQNKKIAELDSRVKAIQNAPKTNTPTTNTPTTNTPTVNQAQVNQAIVNSGIFPRLKAAETTAQTALDRSTAALRNSEQEPIGNRALGLGAGNAQAIAKLDQDIKQLKAPNLLEPRVDKLETKIREREKVDAAANQKLDQLTADRSKLEQLLVLAGGLALMAPQIINNLGPKIDGIPERAANAVAAAPCNGKGCGGKTAARVDGISDELGALRQQVNSIPNTVGNVVNAGANAVQIPLLNTINSKLGAPVPGGIGGLLNNVSQLVDSFSKSFERFAKWSQMDRALNLLTTIATIHNAYMLSNGLTQTLFSMLSNSLAVFGIKDYSQDKDGQPFDVGKIFNDFINNVAKAALGTETVDGIKTEWKKYSRIYQAASNILWSFQSIGYSILGALEIVANWNALVANALKKFGVVGERAYKWFNPEVNFQNRFFTAIDKAENFVSNVDQVAQEVLSIEDTVGQMGTQEKELKESLAQLDGSPQRTQPPEAAKVAVGAATEKTSSASPPISPADQIKPES